MRPFHGIVGTAGPFERWATFHCRCRLSWSGRDRRRILHGAPQPTQSQTPQQNSFSEYTTSGTLANAALVTGLDGPGTITVLGLNLLVTNAGRISEYTTSGTLVTADFITAPSSPTSIAVAGSILFVLYGRSGTVAEFTASGAVVNASLITGLSDAETVAVSGSNLYVLESTNKATLAEYTTTGLLVNSDVIPISSEGFNGVADSVAVSDSAIYVGNELGVLNEYALDGTPIRTLFQNNNGPDVGMVLIPSIPQATPIPQVQIVQQPSDSTDGQFAANVPLVVAVENQDGDLLTTNSPELSVSIANGPAGATLGGTTTIQPINAIAKFSNVTFSMPGTYALAISDGTDAPLVTADFIVGGAASITLASSSPVSAVTTQPVTFTATVTSTFSAVALPTGTVNFVDQNGTVLNTANVQADGTASFTSTFAQPGPQMITAYYSGDSTNSHAASSAQNETIVQATAAMNPSASAVTVSAGQSVQIPIASGSQKLAIKTKEYSPFNLQLKALPADLAPGNYELVIETIDASGSVNVATSAGMIQVSAPFVRPVVTISAVRPATARPGTVITFTVTVQNTGNISAKSWSLLVSPMLDSSATTGPALINLTRHTPIRAGQTLRLKLQAKIPANLTTGTYLPVVSATLDGVNSTITGTGSFVVS